MHMDRAMVTERQRGAQAALFSSSSEAGFSGSTGQTAELADGADERRRVVDRLRRRWALVRQRSEAGSRGAGSRGAG
jgi:hypothetical protein